jgi:hypothetical protein
MIGGQEAFVDIFGHGRIDNTSQWFRDSGVDAVNRDMGFINLFSGDILVVYSDKRYSSSAFPGNDTGGVNVGCRQPGRRRLVRAQMVGVPQTTSPRVHKRFPQRAGNQNRSL